MQYRLIEMFGGLHGVRDQGAVEAAVFRPQTGYYNSIPEEAVALMESLGNHGGFLDGNKRIAFTAADVFLRRNGSCIEVGGWMGTLSSWARWNGTNPAFRRSSRGSAKILSRWFDLSLQSRDKLNQSANIHYPTLCPETASENPRPMRETEVQTGEQDAADRDITGRDRRRGPDRERNPSLQSVPASEGCGDAWPEVSRRCRAQGVPCFLLPGVRIEGSGLALRHEGRTDVPPLISIHEFSAQAGILGLPWKPWKVDQVKLKGLTIQIPPKEDRGNQKWPKAKNIPVLIGEIVSDDAELRLLPSPPIKIPTSSPFTTW